MKANIPDERGAQGAGPSREIRARPLSRCILCNSEGTPLYRDLMDRVFYAPGKWNIRKCSSDNCGLLWMDPMPLEEDLILAYENYYTHDNPKPKQSMSLGRRLTRLLDAAYLLRKYGHGDGIFPPWLKPLAVWRALQPLTSAKLDFSVMYLPPVKCGRLIEIGCGNGDILQKLRELGWSVEGVDFDAKAVEAAKTKGLNVHQGALESQSYPNNSFEAVIMSHVIEHVYHPDLLLTECLRILKPGGRMVIVTPNVSSAGHRLFSSAWRALEPPRHLHLFTLQALNSMAEKAGFTDNRIFSTVREADNLFAASRDIKLKGRHIWASSQPFLIKKFARFFAFFEWSCVAFFPLAGEELVLIAKKQE